jgi:hypothetical protein
VTLTGSADIAASIDGYYGISVLHVGVGVAADMSANVQAAASFNLATDAWAFSGSASLVGQVTAYAGAVAWPLKAEVYINGGVNAAAAVNSTSGIASASITVNASVGADVQMQSLFGGWTTIASTSHSLGSWQYGTSFNLGSVMLLPTAGQTSVLSASAPQQTSIADLLEAGYQAA